MTARHVAVGALSAGLAGVAAATVAATVRHDRVAADVRRRVADATHEQLGDIGTVERLRVLPLVDRAVARPDLRGEPGVSYLVEADGERLLFDTGLNLLGHARSALVENAEALGVDLADVRALVLSHAHDDHVGGPGSARAGTFSYAGEPMEPRGLVAHVPVPLRHRTADVRVTTRATVLARGVALLPPLPAAMFWEGAPVLEQALVVNVRGRGLVLVSGCGHPGVPLLLEVARDVLDVPLHGVVGGLHLPVHPWPRHLPQAFTGGRPPWDLVGEDDVDRVGARLRAAGVSFVAVSGHDSTPWTVRRLAAALGGGSAEVRVGEPIDVAAPQ